MYVVKLKSILCVLFIFFLALIGCFFVIKPQKEKTVFLSPNSKFLVVVDAGHGGIDGGSVGKTTKIAESELNLRYAKNLAEQLNDMNISVVLTRADGKGLYDENAKNLKKSDMKVRKEIIEKYNPNLIVSIHMNSYTRSSTRGAQAFFKKGNKQGEILANCIQKQLNCNLEYAKSKGKVGDYYMVNCTDKPSVLVECGFLSNPEEEGLLCDKAYETKVCYSIMSGIVSYLNFS